MQGEVQAERETFFDWPKKMPRKAKQSADKLSINWNARRCNEIGVLQNVTRSAHSISDDLLPINFISICARKIYARIAIWLEKI